MFIQILLVLYFLTSVLPVCGSNPPTVKIGKTTFIGRDVSLLKQDFFGGIPFAEPPLGKLRLKRPVPRFELEEKTFRADSFGPGCLQPNIPNMPVPNLSEDCLTINVFRPSSLPHNAKLPVLFWTYGGGFVIGASSVYNGSAIVAQSVTRGTPTIYVNFNYRLGPLGFPQGQEADDNKILNLALSDQLAALEWVQRNIEKFGGDKNKVTVFGESAGSIMTAIQFLNPDLQKVARAGIFESGSAATSLNFDAAHREINWQNFVRGVPSCASTAVSGDTLDCLERANSSEVFAGLLQSLSEATEEFPYDPTIDGLGGFYPDIPSRLFTDNRFAKLPFIAGTNLDEGSVFVPLTLNSEQAVHDFIISSYTPPIGTEQQLETATLQLLELYPDIPSLGSPFNTGNETFGLPTQFKQSAAIDGDISFQSQRRFWIQTASRAGVKTFGYLFTQKPATPSPFGVAHGSEVSFVYGSPADQSPSALALSTTMIDYWVSFANSLDPNDGRGSKRPHWAQYTPTNEVLMQLNGENTTLIPDNYRAQQIDFINSIPAIFHH